MKVVSYKILFIEKIEDVSYLNVFEELKVLIDKFVFVEFFVEIVIVEEKEFINKKILFDEFVIDFVWFDKNGYILFNGERK